MGNFETTTDIVRGTAIVRVKGYLSGLSGERLESEIGRLVSGGRKTIVINFGETEMVNSVGVSILVGIIERIRDAGGTLSFAELSPVNEEVFRLMGLHRHVRFLPSPAVAGREGGGEWRRTGEENR